MSINRQFSRTAEVNEEVKPLPAPFCNEHGVTYVGFISDFCLSDADFSQAGREQRINQLPNTDIKAGATWLSKNYCGSQDALVFADPAWKTCGMNRDFLVSEVHVNDSSVVLDEYLPLYVAAVIVRLIGNSWHVVTSGRYPRAQEKGKTLISFNYCMPCVMEPRRTKGTAVYNNSNAPRMNEDIQGVLSAPRMEKKSTGTGSFTINPDQAVVKCIYYAAGLRSAHLPVARQDAVRRDYIKMRLGDVQNSTNGEKTITPQHFDEAMKGIEDLDKTYMTLENAQYLFFVVSRDPFGCKWPDEEIQRLRKGPCRIHMDMRYVFRR